MIIWLSLLIALVGLLMYVLSGNPKLAEIGRLMFGSGLLAFLICICHSGAQLGIVPR